jgi:hypothetical protein
MIMLLVLSCKIKFTLCLIKHRAIKIYKGIVVDPTAACTFNLGTRERWVVSFAPRPLIPQGTSPRYPLYRRTYEPQSRMGSYEEEKIISSYWKTNSDSLVSKTEPRQFTEIPHFVLLLLCNWIYKYLHLSIVTSICVNKIIILSLLSYYVLCYVILITPHLCFFGCLFVYFLH